MGVNSSQLRRIVESFGERGQSKAARQMRIPKSTLSRILSSADEAEKVTWRLVQRMADGAGVPFTSLWHGPLPDGAAAELKVPRGTSGAVRETARIPYRKVSLAQPEMRGALWAVEQMSLALADIARRAREGDDP